MRIARRLDRHLIARREAIGEEAQALGRGDDLAGMANDAVLPDRDLRELAVHV